MTPYVDIRGDGPDLVLLHGWALHGGMWGPWIDELARHARLHLVDLPGHGRSPFPPGLGDLAGFAAAVRPVVPDGAALAASAALLDAGYFVPAIRPPTVPAGSSRLRFTFSAAHADEDLERLLAALSTLVRRGLLS